MHAEPIRENVMPVLFDFDSDPSSVVDPTVVIPKVDGFPTVFVSCFARTQYERLFAHLKDITAIGHFESANLHTPIYRATYQGQTIGLIMAEVGAPACVGMFEEIFAKGAEAVVLYGTCGVLDPEIQDCAIILPTAAVRDEGTSFHYAAPSREIAVNTEYEALFEAILKEHKIPYHKGKTWTTDAFYRETRKKVEERQAEGCITVEMEAASMAAMARFRGKHVLHFFYAADNLAASEWEERSLSGSAKVEEKDLAGLLALEAAVEILKTIPGGTCG